MLAAVIDLDVDAMSQSESGFAGVSGSRVAWPNALAARSSLSNTAMLSPGTWNFSMSSLTCWS